MTSPRPGDRVRITCEGVVITVRPGDTWPLVVKLDGSARQEEALTQAQLDAPTFRLKVLPRPLEVGDRVTEASGWTGKIDYVRGEIALVWWTHLPDPTVERLSDLKPLEPTDGE